MNSTNRVVGYAYVWISLLIALCGMALLVFQPPLVNVAGNLAQDMFQRIRPREYAPAPVRIVDVDEASLGRVGQWPWPRTIVADLVEKLGGMGAAAIVFDMVFAEPDRSSPEIYTRLHPGYRELAKHLRELPSHDSLLAQAFRKTRTVSGFSVTSADVAGMPPEPKARFIIAGDEPRQFLHSFRGAIANLPLLDQAATGSGAFNFHADYDGVVRSIPLVVSVGDALHPSLAAEALRVAQGVRNIVIKSSGASGEQRFGGKTGIVAVQVGELPIRTGPGGEIWLHYSKSNGDRYIPAHAVLSGDVDPAEVAGHIVLVGTSAKGLYDLRFSPLGGTMPGVEMHAQLLEQLIQGTYLQKPDWSGAVGVLILAGGWILAVFTVRLRSVWLVFIALIAVGLIWFGAWTAFSAHRLVVDPLLPSAFVALMFSACGFIRHAQAERERAWIRNAFARYISPNLVSYLMENPGQLQLGGEKRVCSFVLTDIAGFTPFMENTDPVQVATLLNDYLDGMIEIAFRHDATLSGIVGDALALMFSAPVLQEDHADRAVRCAMEMDAFARKFSAAYREKGVMLGDTRIGVHTGEVMIGNFGGKSMFEYRALGDPINTCSRLETVNKQIGTLVMVSEDTKSRCESFRGRPVGGMTLKGKTEEIVAYEPLAEEQCGSDRVRDYLAAYAQLRDGAPEAIESFARLVQLYPDDPLAGFHHERLQRGERGTSIVFLSK